MFTEKQIDTNTLKNESKNNRDLMKYGYVNQSCKNSYAAIYRYGYTTICHVLGHCILESGS